MGSVSIFEFMLLLVRRVAYKLNQSPLRPYWPIKDPSSFMPGYWLSLSFLYRLHYFIFLCVIFVRV